MTTTKTSMRALFGIALVAALALVGLSGCAASNEQKSSGLTNSVTTQEGLQYSLYVGLVDAQSGTQKLTTDEAAAIATPLVTAVGGGYTLTVTQGGYMDDAGKLVENETLVYEGIHAEEAEVSKLINDVKAALGTYSVYVTSEHVGYAIYGGTI